MDCIAELIASGEAWASDGQDAHALNPPAAVRAPARPVRETSRVQLGFRDGTSTTLEPGSEQARALEELAQSLTRRD